MSLLHLHSQNTSTASIPHVHTDHEVEHAFARGKHQEKEPQTMEELLNRLMEGGDDEKKMPPPTVDVRRLTIRKKKPQVATTSRGPANTYQRRTTFQEHISDEEDNTGVALDFAKFKFEDKVMVGKHESKPSIESSASVNEKQLKTDIPQSDTLKALQTTIGAEHSIQLKKNDNLDHKSPSKPNTIIADDKSAVIVNAPHVISAKSNLSVEDSSMPDTHSTLELSKAAAPSLRSTRTLGGTLKRRLTKIFKSKPDETEHVDHHNKDVDPQIIPRSGSIMSRMSRKSPMKSSRLISAPIMQDQSADSLHHGSTSTLQESHGVESSPLFHAKVGERIPGLDPIDLDRTRNSTLQWEKKTEELCHRDSGLMEWVEVHHARQGRLVKNASNSPLVAQALADFENRLQQLHTEFPDRGVVALREVLRSASGDVGKAGGVMRAGGGAGSGKMR